MIGARARTDSASRRRARRSGATLPGRLPGGVLTRELLVTAAHPRALLIKLGVPLLLTLPLLLGHAPSFWAATLLTVLCAMVGAVGSAVGLARARQSGLLARLAVTPRSGARLLLGWSLAGAAVDALQLLPMLAAIWVIGRGDPVSGAALLPAVVAVLLLASALGCAVSLLGSGVGEVLLDVAVLLAPLLFLGGVFTGVPRSGWRAVAAAVDPFGQLQSGFIGALGGSPAFTAGWITAISAASIAAALGAIALIGDRVLGRA